MPERYVVAGCAGFIASKVAQLLLQAGQAVVGVDNLTVSIEEGLRRSVEVVFRQLRHGAAAGTGRPERVAAT